MSMFIGIVATSLAFTGVLAITMWAVEEDMKSNKYWSDDEDDKYNNNDK